MHPGRDPSLVNKYLQFLIQSLNQIISSDIYQDVSMVSSESRVYFIPTFAADFINLKQ